MKTVAVLVAAGALLCFSMTCFAQGGAGEQGTGRPENGGNSGWWIERGKGMDENSDNSKEIAPVPDTGQPQEQGGSRGDPGPAGPGTGTTGDLEKGPMRNQGPIVPNPQR